MTVYIKALVARDAGNAPEVEELRLPEIGPGQVRVRIRAAGVCHSDLSMVNGTLRPPHTLVLGHEAAGEVVETGDGVEGFAEGDHVVLAFVPSCGDCEPCRAGRAALCEPGAAANTAGTLLAGERRLHDADGGTLHHHLGVSAFADHVVVAAESAVRVDADLPYEIAALFGCAVLTGVGAVLNSAQVQEGDSVAIFGLGGVGLAALLGAKVAGASTIVAVDVVPEKLALAQRLGATHVVDASKDDPVVAIKDLTRGGADYTFEAVGNVKVIRQALEALGAGGALTIVGVPKLGTSAEFVVHALYQNKAILGCRYGTARPRRDFPMLADLYLGGRLKIDELITRHYALDQFDAALADLRAGNLARGVFSME